MGKLSKEARAKLMEEKNITLKVKMKVDKEGNVRGLIKGTGSNEALYNTIKYLILFSGDENNAAVDIVTRLAEDIAEIEEHKQKAIQDMFDKLGRVVKALGILSEDEDDCNTRGCSACDSTDCDFHPSNMCDAEDDAPDE